MTSNPFIKQISSQQVSSRKAKKKKAPSIDESIEMALLSMGYDVPEVKTQAISFTLRDLKGNKVALRNYRGKVVFLSFWATWCPPCVHELPNIERLRRKMKGYSFKILTVEAGGDKFLAQEQIQKVHGAFSVLLDLSKKVSRKYSISFWPTTYLIDSKGRWIAKIKGVQSWTNPQFISLLKSLSHYGS
ncbi:MAG: hypothetical protein IEMM0008_1871 [bacterium]|nr:MAG: hypothetical protein IEMM0008_1871 [bacterium]